MERRQIRTPGATPDHALGGVPIGTILDFAGNSAPEGFLICNGASFNVGDYPDLYAVIGIIWGGDGSPGFNVPDLQDSFTKGKGSGDNVGNSGGSNTANHSHSVTSNVSVGNHSLSIANLPSHNHSINHGHGISESSRTIDGGSHSHKFYNFAHDNAVGGTAPVCVDDAGQIANTQTEGGHSHGAHTHSVSVTSHTGSSGSTGSGSAVSHSVTNNAVTSVTTNIDNRPAYKTVHKIIKY